MRSFLLGHLLTKTCSKSCTEIRQPIDMNAPNQWDVQDITLADIKPVVNNYQHTAPGLDKMYPGDFKHYPDIALEWIARLLNLIEAGSPWPSSTTHAAGHLLAKPAARGVQKDVTIMMRTRRQLVKSVLPGLGRNMTLASSQFRGVLPKITLAL